MSTDPFPLVTVEVAFEPSTNTPPAYTDVSADHVEAVETSYKIGRQYETDTIEPGTGSVQLNNDAGAYTGNRPGSPYYPYVKPQRRVRVRCIVPPGNLLAQAVTLAPAPGSWTANDGNTTVSSVATPRMAGTTSSLALKATAAGAASAYSTAIAQTPVVPAGTYTATAWARSSTTSARTAVVSINWYTAAGAYITTTSSAAAAIVQGDFTQVTVTGRAPANAGRGSVVGAVQGLAAGETAYIAAVLLCPDGLTAADLATGRTSSFGTSWPGGVGLVSRSDVSFTDGFARLKRRALASVYREEVLLDTPLACYPLSDPAGSPTASNIAPTPQPPAVMDYVWSPIGSPPAAWAFGESGIVPSDPGSALKFTPDPARCALYVARNGLGPFVDVTRPWAVEMVIQPLPHPAADTFPGQSTSDVIWTQSSADYDGLRFWLYDHQDGTRANFIFDYLTTVNSGDGFSFPIVYGQTYHVLFQYTGTAVEWWVNGVQRGGYAIGPAYNRRWIESKLSGQGEFTGTIAYLALYQHSLAAARVAAHGQAVAGFVGERADQRIGRLLTYAGWPAADRALDPGLSPLGPHLTSGTDAATAIQTAAADDGGIVFVDPAARATFQNRYRRLNQPVEWTLDTRAQDLGVDLSFPLDDARVLNIVTASTGQSDSTTIRVTDAASGADFGDIATDLTFNLRDAVDLEAAAYWTLALESQPQPRSATINVDPLTSPALWSFVLFSSLGDVVELDNLPTQAPSSTMRFLIESKTWAYVRSGAEGRWTVSCEVSPYLPVQTSVATFAAAAGDPLPTGITDPHTWDAVADFDGSDYFAW